MLDRVSTFVVAVVCTMVLQTHAVRVTSCSRDPNTDIFRVNSVEVHPSPIQLPGEFTLAFTGNVLKPIGSMIQAEVTISRKLGFMWIDLPCVNMPGPLGQIGSCTYRDICGIISQANSTGACPNVLIRNGIQCTCPMQPGPYRIGQTKFSVNLKRLGINLPAGAISGDYQASFRLRDSNTLQELLCYDIEVSIADPPSATTFGSIGRFFVNLFG